MAHFEGKALGTRLIHVGQEPDPVTGAVCVPISMATTFAQKTPGLPSGQESSLSYGKGYEYSRTGNPTRAAFEQAVASAESGKYAVAFASGMAATTALIHLLESGDHVVCIDDVYGGTQRYFRRTVQPTYGINFTFIDMSDPAAVEAAFTDKTKMLWVESPTNPTLKVTDLRMVCEIARKRGAISVVDNTFMSPIFQRPLELGADVSMNSVTKYINGHSDIVMGIASTNSEEILDKLRFVQNGVGAVPSPTDCYFALRGLKTLHIRMERHAQNAQVIAELLESSDMVDKVHYPGLASHPQHEIAKGQTDGFGGMITFWIKGDINSARRFMETVKVFTLAESLGAVESLCESPAIMTHASVPADKRAELGISDTLIRLSVGIENIDDLKADVEQALEAARATLA